MEVPHFPNYNIQTTTSMAQTAPRTPRPLSPNLIAPFLVGAADPPSLPPVDPRAAIAVAENFAHASIVWEG